MTILLTGFEPFDGADSNPSWEAVSLIPDTLQGHAIHRLRLPVEYDRAAAILKEEIARLHPDVVISVGVAGGRKAVTPELLAINYRYARIADNAGVMHRGDAIDPQGETARMTRLPVHQMIDAMNAAEVPAALSLSAGAYVCNDVYYALLSCEEALGHRGLFVHVPAAADLPVPTVAKGLTLCIETLLKADV